MTVFKPIQFIQDAELCMGQTFGT